VATNSISYSDVSDKELPLVVMRISFSVRCDYSRFKKLLHEFEDGTALDRRARRRRSAATWSSRARCTFSSTS
jgi:hypothetical protein